MSLFDSKLDLIRNGYLQEFLVYHGTSKEFDPSKYLIKLNLSG